MLSLKSDKYTEPYEDEDYYKAQRSYETSNGVIIYYTIIGDKNDVYTKIKIYNSSKYSEKDIRELLEYLKYSEGYVALNINLVMNEWKWHKIAYIFRYAEESTVTLDAYIGAYDNEHNLSWIMRIFRWY